MNTKEMTQEQISAFADGALADQQVDVALAALRRTDGRADWEMYHQIGDVLRSDDMDVQFSSGFAARMAARLELEPAIIAPVSAEDNPLSASASESAVAAAGGVVMPAKRPIKRWAVPGMVAAAVATAAFIATPQLMVAMKTESAAPGAQMIAASAEAARASSTPGNTQIAVASASAPEGVVLRDARIDDYLFAHQRFSPSVYSTAQYARSATFATDSNK